ncbi:monocarboxylate permease [Lipomyces mesembrius]
MVDGAESASRSIVKQAGPPPPPNGGLTAWLQVTGGFMIFFNTWGLINTFAVFQTYYESGALFTESSSNIFWSAPSSYLRLLLLTGSFMALLAQAICVVIGSGLLFTPTVSLLPTWFSSHIGLAVGIASSGSSLGGVIGPIGFPWAVRAVAFITLGTFIIPVIVMKQRIKSPKPRALIDWSAFTDAPYITFALAVLIVFIGNSVLISYISYYPINKGFTNSSLGFYVVAIFNAVSIFGRIAPNAVSDRIGVFNTFHHSLLYARVTNTAGIIVGAVVTGFFSGVIVALPPDAYEEQGFGTRIGQGFAIGGLGLLIGGPSAGAILGTTEPLNWTDFWVYGGVAIAVAGFILIAVRIMKAGPKLMVKA